MLEKNLVLSYNLKVDFTRIGSFSQLDLLEYARNNLIGLIIDGIKIVNINKILVKDDKLSLQYIKDCCCNINVLLNIDGDVFKKNEEVTGELVVKDNICYFKNESLLLLIKAKNIDISYTWVNIDKKKIENNSIIRAKITHIVTVGKQTFFNGECVLL